MTIKRGGISKSEPKISSQRFSSFAVLESLSETRISVLYLARQAKEAKDNVLAKELTARGETLRTEMSRLRRTLTVDWDNEAKALAARAGTAQAELSKLVREAEKSAKKTKAFTRALGVVSNVLGLAKKVL